LSILSANIFQQLKLTAKFSHSSTTTSLTADRRETSTAALHWASARCDDVMGHVTRADRQNKQNAQPENKLCCAMNLSTASLCRPVSTQPAIKMQGG